MSAVEITSAHDRPRMRGMRRTYAHRDRVRATAARLAEQELRSLWSPSRTGRTLMSAPRYCQCGKRLARDHAGTQCGICEREGMRQRAEPPAVPAGFWHTPAFRDAFDAQHMGHIARAYRRHPLNVTNYGRDGIPQELLGDWLGLTQAQVSRIENGPPIRNLDTLAHWARTLRIPPDLLWFRLPGEKTPIGTPIHLTTGMLSAPPMPRTAERIVSAGTGRQRRVPQSGRRSHASLPVCRFASRWRTPVRERD